MGPKIGGDAMGMQLRSWWQKIKQHPFIVTGIIVVILAVIAFIFAAYRFGWSGTGFLNKTLWDWLQLLIAPVVISLVGLWFTRVQQQRDNRLAQQQHDRDQELAQQRADIDRQIALDNQREVALQAYLDKMTELLLKEHLGELTPEGKLKPEYQEVREIARVRTLTVLGGLDAMRKRSVLLFLHEAGLLGRGPEGTREPIINLWDADFSQAHLSRAHLIGVSLSKANLTGADLSRTYLSKAKFHRAVLREANLSNDNRSAVDSDEEPNLREADLSGAYLSNANLHNADLTGADLRGTDLRGAKSLDTAKLHGAKYNTKEIQEKDTEGNPITIKQTQWPQGFDYHAAGSVCVDC
jgi:membrane protein implicated in regulation of membrane protease activity